jgi:hypothetical protein
MVCFWLKPFGQFDQSPKGEKGDARKHECDKQASRGASSGGYLSWGLVYALPGGLVV